MHTILGNGLIGATAIIVDAKNRQLIGLAGIVVDETKHTLIIKVGGKKKRVIKKDVTLRIGRYIIDGKLLYGRPEERLKVNE